MASAVAMAQDPSNLFMGGSSIHTDAMLEAAGQGQQQISLQPVFIPRHHLLGGGGGRALQQARSPPSDSLPTVGGPASADWAFLLRNAGMLSRGTSGSTGPQLDAVQQQQQQQQHQMHLLAGSSAPTSMPQGQQDPSVPRSPSPHQVLGSPSGPYMVVPCSSASATTPPGMGGGGGGGLRSSGSGLFVNHGAAAAAAASSGMMHVDALGDLSSSYVMLSNGSIAPTLSAMYGDPSASVQTLYSSDNATAVAAVRASAAHSLLQQQAAAAAAANSASLANSLGGLTSTLSLTGLGQLEESLSGSLFGPGAGAVAALSPKPVSASLYIKNLPNDADKLFLYEKFSPYGAILSVKVLNDPQTGHCRGVGFVNFAEHGAAMRSIQALHGTKVGDKLLHVSLQTPRLRAATIQTM